MGDDIYYLESILRQLRSVANSFNASDCFGLGDMILEDNINWLECYIDRLKKC